MEVFEAKEKLLKELNWSENPFVKDLRTSDKNAFLKYYYALEAQKILQKLAFDSKACMLLGPKGVGKTSALFFVKYSLPEKEYDVIFFKEPPQSMQDLAEEAGLVSKGGLMQALSKLLGGSEKKISREEVIGKLKNKGKKIVFFIDEAPLEKNQDMYMEFKYLLDDAPNLRLVICALGKEGFPDSLVQLIGEHNVFTRKGFTQQEMVAIIEHRIKAVGGKALKPFPEVFLEKTLTEQNLLSPRYVFDELNNFLAGLAMGKSEWQAASEYAGDSLIQGVISQSAREKKEKLTTSHADWWIQLSPSQKQIVEKLIRFQNGLTLSEIMKETGLSQNTAFNALYQMRGDDEAERKRKPQVPFPLIQVQGKSVGGRKKNLYFVDQKIKNLFTLH